VLYYNYEISNIFCGNTTIPGIEPTAKWKDQNFILALSALRTGLSNENIEVASFYFARCDSSKGTIVFFL